MIRGSSNTIFTKPEEDAPEHEYREANIRMKLTLKRMLKTAGKKVKINDVQDLAAAFRQHAPAALLNTISENPLYFLNNIKTSFDAIAESSETVKEMLANKELMLELITEIILPREIHDKKKLASSIERNFDKGKREKHINEMIAAQIGWRLFVDGIKQRVETPQSYDNREPGCLLAMAEAFNGAIENIDENLTFEHIIDIHNQCILKVGNLNEEQTKHGKEGYRKGSEIVGFSVPSTGEERTMTPNGLRDLCLHEGADKDYTYRCKRILGILHGEQLNKRIQFILSQYNKNMASLQNPTEKLACIVSMIAHLERIHPFYDANCRTLCVILLNRELLKHGFPPTILDDPNRFDAFSTEELMAEVVKGFHNYEHVKSKGVFPEEPSRKFDEESAVIINQINKAMGRLKSRAYAQKASVLLDPHRSSQLEESFLSPPAQSLLSSPKQSSPEGSPPSSMRSSPGPMDSPPSPLGSPPSSSEDFSPSSPEQGRKSPLPPSQSASKLDISAKEWDQFGREVHHLNRVNINSRIPLNKLKDYFNKKNTNIKELRNILEIDPGSDRYVKNVFVEIQEYIDKKYPDLSKTSFKRKRK